VGLGQSADAKLLPRLFRLRSLLAHRFVSR
jgi:hypothetical protein